MSGLAPRGVGGNDKRSLQHDLACCVGQQLRRPLYLDHALLTGNERSLDLLLPDNHSVSKDTGTHPQVGKRGREDTGIDKDSVDARRESDGGIEMFDCLGRGLWRAVGE